MGRRWIGGWGREERAKAGVSPGRRIGRGWPGASEGLRREYVFLTYFICWLRRLDGGGGWRVWYG